MRRRCGKEKSEEYYIADEDAGLTIMKEIN
jgi:hypothetical protein